MTTGLAAPRSRVHVHGPSSHSARDLDRAPDLLGEEAVVSRVDNPAGPSAMRSCPVVQQLDGCLDTAGEELIGQVAVCEHPGELQRAEHQSEEGDRVGSIRLGVCRVETRRDVVDDAHQFVGEELFGGGGAAGDFVEQRGRRAAVGVMVAVLRGQVGADERRERSRFRAPSHLTERLSMGDPLQTHLDRCRGERLLSTPVVSVHGTRPQPADVRARRF